MVQISRHAGIAWHDQGDLVLTFKQQTRVEPYLHQVVTFAIPGLICYLLSVQSGYLQLCIPYIDGCNSISATGRTPPASLLFRAIELPFAGLLLVLWPLTVAWLRSLTPSLGNTTARAVLICGTIGAVALIIYTMVFGYR